MIKESKIACKCGAVLKDTSVDRALILKVAVRCGSCKQIVPYTNIVELAAKPLHRSGSPATSAEGAAYILPKLKDRQVRAFRFVQKNPGKTATELSNIAEDRDPRTIGRRLNELEKLGLITRCKARPCSSTGRNAATWEAVSIEAADGV